MGNEGTAQPIPQGKDEGHTQHIHPKTDFKKDAIAICLQLLCKNYLGPISDFLGIFRTHNAIACF